MKNQNLDQFLLETGGEIPVSELKFAKFLLAQGLKLPEIAGIISMLYKEKEETGLDLIHPSIVVGEKDQRVMAGIIAHRGGHLQKMVEKVILQAFEKNIDPEEVQFLLHIYMDDHQAQDITALYVQAQAGFEYLEA